MSMATGQKSSVRGPLNLKQWIEDNKHLMKPPVSNRTIWKDQDFIVFVSAGPNTRNDYHVNPTEEFFYQVKGDVYVKIMEEGGPRNVVIREGEILLIPSWVPHSPQRPEGTIGLVVEYLRPEGQMDSLRFYCQDDAKGKGCGALVYEEHFTLTDIDNNLKRIMEHFWGGDESVRTCKDCGKVITRANEARLPS